MGHRIVLAVAALAGGAAFPAVAETAHSFQVSAAIVGGCIVTASAGQLGRIDFGTIAGTTRGSIDASLLSSGASGIQLECTPGIALSVSADAGTHAAADGTRRLGLNGGTAATVPYQLYADGSATPWTTQVLSLAFAVAGPSKRTLPVTGRATLAGPTAAGAYSDTVRVTLAW